ncbi:hypothetical protein PHLCEN_2v4593 [Hermanssonia centrifuga]|uniref:Uncharacterized protein n=1 Tax=Hermanssonia centrifuga TaxID=98765 RepID=A0A2R6PNE1_9APHY|nr:hypothetical protein PHLCEN_2v4593 [Hermanssonia centrifuga]
MARSQGVPLTAHYRVSHSRRRGDELPSLRIALEAVHRIRTLELHIPWTMYEKVSGSMHGSAPILRCLKMRNPHSLSNVGRTPPVLAINRETFPELETLELYCYGFSWSELASCHKLKHLNIDYAVFVRPTLPTVSEVLDTLDALPHLVTLNLNNVLSIFPQASMEEPRTVTLPHLEHLILSGDATACASLLDSLSFPQCARITLLFGFIGENELPILLPPIHSRLTGASSIGASAPFHSFAFGLDFKRSLVVRGWTSTLQVESEETELAQFEPKFHLELPRWALEFDVIWNGLPLQDVRSVWVMSNLVEELSLASQLDMLRKTPHAISVRFSQWPAKNLCDLLGVDDHDGTVILPSLRTLVLDKLNFQLCIAHENGHHGCLQHLESVLESRRSRHAGLYRLILEECWHVSALEVGCLRDVGAELIWDGIERIKEDLATDSDSGMDPAVEGYED